MVLQDVDSSPDGFSDNPYPSENDAYASSSSGSRFEASSLPQPIPILGPLLGFPDAAVRFKTESTLKFAERRLRRALTCDESQALATHLYKLEQTKSYFTAIGAGVGTWRWYTTMEQCRYPLYKPKPEDINPNKFLFVRGPMAQYARHSWRLLLYMFVAGEMGKLLGQITAQPLAARSTANDPRLGQFAADLKVAVESDTTHARVVRVQQEKEWKELIERERAAKEAARRAELPGAGPRKPWTPTPQKREPVEDDMSPTAGNESWSPTSGGSWGDSDFSSDPAQTPQAKQQRPSQPLSSISRRPPPPAYDDASPTGGLFQEEAQNQSKPGESAWERLRRGAAPPPVQRRQPPRREQQEESTLGDGFAFPESEEERKRAQERAQREFDARIERERQGKDFNEERR